MSGRVFILTTEGPVEIQSILEEVPGVRSVVCVNGRAEALPISNAYNAFVRQPTGLIERITGHDSYWMDVSDRIEEGQSWQLGAYIAHVATEQGDLNKDVYATGEVAHDGTVRPVAFVDRKLAALSQLGNAVILVPADTAPQMAEAGGARVVEIASVGDALAAVGLLPPEIRTAKKKSFTGSERMQTLKGLALATVIAACFFWLGIEPARWGAMHSDGRLLDLETELDSAEGVGKIQAGLFHQWMRLWRPDRDDIRIEGSVFAAPEGQQCGSREQQTSFPIEATPAGTSVCGIQMRAFAEGPFIIGRLAYWPDGLGSSSKPERVLRGNAEMSGRSWTLETEAPMPKSAKLRLAVVAGPADVKGSQPWYSDLLAAPIGSAALDTAMQRLYQLGYDVRVLDLP